MLRLRRSDAEIQLAGPVLKAEQLGAVLTAQEIILKAQAEAERIREEAKVECERQRKIGYEEGLQQGKAEMSEKLVASISHSARYLSEVESALVDVVMKALRRVLGEFDDRERVDRAVTQALEVLRQQAQVRVKVSPAQLAWLQSRVAALGAAFPRIQFLDIQADPRLPSDGCVVETEFGVIDATVETQLRAIEKALIQAIR